MKKIALFLCLLLMIFNININAQNELITETTKGRLSYNLYQARPVSITDESIYFYIIYKPIFKTNPYAFSPKIFKYDLKTSGVESIFALDRNETVLNLISDERKTLLLSYDGASIIIRTRSKKGIIKKEILSRSNSKPYTFTTEKKICICYEDSNNKEGIVTKFTILDIDANQSIVKTCELIGSDEAYNGEYLSVVGGSDGAIYVSIISMKNGNFKGKNVISKIYEYDDKRNELVKTEAEYNFLVNAICGDSKYIIIDEYNEEDPNSQTLNIFYIKENKNINLAEKTNKMRIKNILKTENKFIIEADKDIYELNLTQSVLKIIYDEELDSLLYHSNKIYLYYYDSNYEQFILRLIKWKGNMH